MPKPVLPSQALLEHSESVAPARPRSPVGSQTGCVAGHCAEVTHSTQVSLGELYGVAVGQSEFAVHAGAASIGGAVLHSWSIHTNPSVHGRLASITPSELQSAGDVQQTTGFGLLHEAARHNARNATSRMRRGCRNQWPDVNDSARNERIRCIALHIVQAQRGFRRLRADPGSSRHSLRFRVVCLTTPRRSASYGALLME